MYREDGPVGKAYPCKCSEAAFRSTILRKLVDSCGLKGGEHDIRFPTLKLSLMQGDAINCMKHLKGKATSPSGFVTLYGSVGTGKTTLLMATVNECIANGIDALYLTLPQLLGELRYGFDPDANVDYSRRWSILTEVTVLCLDEVDNAHMTSWAKEKFHELIDLRYRGMLNTMTVIAMNCQPSDLDSKVASRLSSGKMYVLNGKDIRPIIANTTT